jgi:hypothetical protein
MIIIKWYKQIINGYKVIIINWYKEINWYNVINWYKVIIIIIGYNGTQHYKD